MSDEDVLTAEEIEALTNSESGEELSGESVVTAYDFQQPAHTKRGHLPTLDIIHEKTANHFRDLLGFMLQERVEVTASALETIKYGDFVYALPIPININKMHIPQLGGDCVLCFDTDLLETVIDKYFGAAEKEAPEEEAADESTEEAEESEEKDESEEEETANAVEEKEEFSIAELRISRRLLDRMIESLQHGWKTLGRIDVEHKQTEHNPRMINLVDHGELVVAVSFNISIGSRTGTARLAVPYKALDKVKNRLRAMVQSNHAGHDKKWLSKMYEGLQTVPIEVVGELDKLQLTVDRLINMQVGDVLPMRKPQAVTIYVDGNPIFQGVMGDSKGQAAVQVSSWINNNK